ncbi:MAG: leucine-rich repeat domain-containing protein [Muribaculaceae bacterium]|nr:leucine-rich repeat domain-containing protein [Muribaculaceae bacterium]MBR5171402.1 leucine-rich repeat domain-containing protein [Muribaculaceae bacterium]
MNSLNKFFLGLLTAIIPVMVMAYDFKEGGLCFNYNEDGKSVTMTYEHLIMFAYDAPAPKEKGYIGNIVIPSVVNHDGKGYTVTAIDRETFMCNTELERVSIPSTVTFIGMGAFSHCSRLKEVVLPPDLTEISDYMFAESGLKSILIPSKVKSIGQWAFSSSSLESIYMPNSVTKIEKSAFSACRWLEEVELSNKLESIGEAAFSICTSLKTITLPSTLKEIGPKAFYECSDIETITIPASVSSIGDGAFSSCKALNSIKVEKKNKKYNSRNKCNAIIETATNTLVAGCKDTKIPNSVATIEDEAFYGCYDLKNADIPTSVTKIGSQAFFYCKSIKEVVIPESVTSIGERAFCGCDSLETVTISNSVKHIGYAAFLHDKKIKSVIIGSGVTAIDEWAFKGLDNLEYIICKIEDVSNVKMGKNVFDEIDKSKCILYVPKGSKDNFGIPQWEDFKNQLDFIETVDPPYYMILPE